MLMLKSFHLSFALLISVAALVVMHTVSNYYTCFNVKVEFEKKTLVSDLVPGNNHSIHIDIQVCKLKQVL